MRDRPSAAELLEIARRTLLDELLAALPEDRRYDALMVASAMATAKRELEAGLGALETERAALAALYDEPADPAEPLDAALARLNRRFAADLRAGAFDGEGPRARAAGAVLRQQTHSKLLENNPKYPR